MDPSQFRLCNVCNKIDFEGGFQGSWVNQIPLGPLALIFQKRLHCNFCNMICESLEARCEGFEVPMLDYNGIPIFCNLSSGNGGRSREVNGVITEERLLKVELSGHWEKDYGGMKIGIFQLADTEQPELFLRRRIDRGRINFDTVKEWLHSCETWHIAVGEFRGVRFFSECQMRFRTRLTHLDVIVRNPQMGNSSGTAQVTPSD